ncbi:MAG TPA: GAF domain-containing protein [Anaerolineae bacterium]|nr:GAF domain-containing protein [Anaerolineae bacterium]
MLPRIRWGGLRNKIIAWSFVPTVIILVAVAVVMFYAYQDVTQDLVIERNMELTRLKADKFMAELMEFTDLLSAEARSPVIYENDPIAQRDALKAASNRLAPFDAGVLILDTFGIVEAVEPERKEIVGEDWSDRSYYLQLLRSQIFGSIDLIISDVVTDGPDGEEVIVIAVPILGSQSEFLGTLVGMFGVDMTTASAFYDDIVKLRLAESGSAYIVDGNGKVIYHSDPGYIGEDFSLQDVVQLVMGGEIGAVRIRALDGQEIVASYAPIPNTSWGLVTQENWTSLLKSSQGYRQFLFLLLALGVVIPALVVAFGVRRITKPITELIIAAQKVAGGDFDQRIRAQTGDEIEELAEQFSLMSAQLQESYAQLERRVAARTEELSALNEIATVVSQSLDLDEILYSALDETLEVMEIEAGGIYLLNERTNVLNLVAQRGFTPEFVAEVDNLTLGEGFSGRVAQSGQPLVVKDISTDPRLTRKAVREEGLRSMASVPLSVKGRVLGTLFAITRGDREFTDQDIQLLTSIGHQIGVAIENGNLYNAAKRRADQFRVISELGRRLTSILAIDELLGQVVSLIQQAFKYDVVEIGLIEKDELVFKRRTKRYTDAPLSSFSLKIGEQGITGKVAATGEPLLVPDVSKDPRYINIDDDETHSELAVPIRSKGKVIGVLNIQSQELDAFDESDLVLTQSLADQVAIAIENARLFNEEQRRADQFRVISEVGGQITSILDVNVLLEEMARLIRDAFDYYHVAFGLIEGDEVVYKAGSGELSDIPGFEFKPSRLKIGLEGITGWVAATGESLYTPDVSKESRYVEMRGSKTRSELTVPITARGKVLGILDVQSDQLNAFDESDMNVLQSLAYQAGVAIENATLFKAEQKRAEHFRLISDVGQRIITILAVDELLEQMARLIKESFNYYHVGFGLVEGDKVISKAEVGPMREAYQSVSLTIGQEGIWGRVAQSGEPLLVPDVSQDPGYYAAQDTKVCSELCVPLISKGEVIGVLDAESDRLDSFDENDLVILQTLANQAAVAIENARLFEQTHQLAAMEERNRLARDLHDAVTQTLFSSSLLAEALPALWEKDQTEGRKLLKEIRQLCRGALAEMRTLLMELRPASLIEASLDELLRQLGDSVTGRTGVPVTVSIEGPHQLPSDVHTAFYRIAQEALNNIVKYAQANQVSVNLRCVSLKDEGARKVELSVMDDGIGFDPSNIPSESLGIGIMRERAKAIGATLEIESEIEHGTEIRVFWQGVQEATQDV